MQGKTGSGASVGGVGWKGGVARGSERPRLQNGHLLCEINVRLSNRGFYVAPIIFYIILVFFFLFDTSIETCALSLAHALAMPDKNTALRID